MGSGCCDAAADADGSFSVVLSVCQETDGQDSCFLVFVLSAISPAFLVHYREISPDWLLCMLLGVVLLMAALLYSETKKGNFGRIVSLGIFVGILTGTYAWLDLWGNVVLLAILVGILQLDREDCRGEKGAAAFCLLVGFFGAFAGAPFFVGHGQKSGNSQ